MYQDYAIGVILLFHWQNSTSEDRGKGYLILTTLKSMEKDFTLCSRAQMKTRLHITMSYVLSEKEFTKGHYGSKPMSITFRIKISYANSLSLERFSKMAVG